MCKACACALATCLIVTWRTLGINFISIILYHMLQRRLRRVSIGKRPLPSSKNPHFENKARCTTFLVKMSFLCMRMKNDFHIKGWAPTLVVKQRPVGTRKWPIYIVFYAFIIYIVAGFFLLADCWKLLFSKVSILILESNSLFSY